MIPATTWLFHCRVEVDHCLGGLNIEMRVNFAKCDPSQFGNLRSDVSPSSGGVAPFLITVIKPFLLSRSALSQLSNSRVPIGYHCFEALDIGRQEGTTSVYSMRFGRHGILSTCAWYIPARSPRDQKPTSPPSTLPSLQGRKKTLADKTTFSAPLKLIDSETWQTILQYDHLQYVSDSGNPESSIHQSSRIDWLDADN